MLGKIQFKQRCHQAGQAMIEYIVALSAVFMLFYVGGGILFQAEDTDCTNRDGDIVTPRECLIDGVKGYYQGHTFALSLSEYPVSSPTLGVPSSLLDLANQICKGGLCDGISLPSGPPGGVPDFGFDPGDIAEGLKPTLAVTIGDVLEATGIELIPSWITDIPILGDIVEAAADATINKFLDIELFEIPFPF